MLGDDKSENGEVEELSGVVGSDLELLGGAFTTVCDPGETVDREASEYGGGMSTPTS